MADPISSLIAIAIMIMSIFSPVHNSNQVTGTVVQNSYQQVQYPNQPSVSELTSFDSKYDQTIMSLSNAIAFNPDSCQKFITQLNKHQFVVQANILLNGGKKTYYIILHTEDCFSNHVEISKTEQPFDLSLTGTKADYLKLKNDALSGQYVGFDVSALHPTGDVSNGVFAATNLTLDQVSTGRLLSVASTITD